MDCERHPFPFDEALHGIGRRPTATLDGTALVNDLATCADVCPRPSSAADA